MNNEPKVPGIQTYWFTEDEAEGVMRLHFPEVVGRPQLVPLTPHPQAFKGTL